MDTHHHVAAHRDHPHHVAGRHRSFAPRTHPHTKHVVKFVLLATFAHFIAHFSWYAFSQAWVHELGFIDPAELGKSIGSAGFAPLVLLAVGVISWIQHLME